MPDVTNSADKVTLVITGAAYENKEGEMAVLGPTTMDTLCVSIPAGTVQVKYVLLPARLPQAALPTKTDVARDILPKLRPRTVNVVEPTGPVTPLGGEKEAMVGAVTDKENALLA